MIGARQGDPTGSPVPPLPIGEGGDGYLSFKKGREIARDKQLSDVLTDYVGTVKTIEPPAMGRLVLA